MAAGEYLEVAGLEFEHHSAGNARFLARSRPTLSARRRMMASVSVKGTSISKVSSAEIDFVGLSATTALWSMPRVSS